tara:strand:+ start:12396 stop:15029 length:2634 start_codon:yes stop_codon:yes gene_type:complete
MKFINKKKIKEKKNKKSFSNIINRYSIIILIFFLGIWAERFDIKLKIKNFTNEITETLASRIYSSFGKGADKLVFDIKYRDYMEILSSREKSIKSFRASEEIHEWVPATMTYKNKKYDIEIKLKGVHSEHWKHPNKWSFKIKLLNENSIHGVRRFSIQKPKTRDFLYEWIFMQVLKEEGLISHRTKYLEAVVNGNNLGIYFFEEQHSKELIENNKRREGPIIGLDKNLWIDEANNLENLTINVLADSFWRAKIKPVQFKDDKIGTEQEIYLKNAINLFEDFRNSKIKINEAFDVDQLARLMAVKAIFGAIEFDWRDIKFYYNPITSLLEPIGREVHINKSFNKNNIWWVDTSDTGVNNSDQKDFLNLLYKDYDFYALYLKELNRLSQEDYIKKVLEKNNKLFNDYKRLLKYNFPLEDIFSNKHINSTRDTIRKTINPIQGINAYFIEYKNDDNILISVQNTQRLPVEIKAIEFNDAKKLFLEKPIIIKGKEHKKPVKNNIINFNCSKKENINNNISCSNYFIKKDDKNSISENNKVIFNILGQNNIRQSEILRFYNSKSADTKNKNINSLDELENLAILNIDKKNKLIKFQKDKINLDKKIIIPEGYLVSFSAGSEIILSGKGQIISYSPVKIIGEENKPIIFKNESGANYGNGITIINANSKSFIKNANFFGLSSPRIESGEGLLGAINFFRSDVIIENSKFENNLGEDFLNIISSDFSIKNVTMNRVNFDAIDFDFSNGSIENVSILNSGNDALDFSGSKVNVKNILINNAGDKGISVGEKSNITVENIKLENTNIALASKDLSNLNLDNVEILNSNVAVAAYQKKPEYGPGFASITNISIKDSKNKFIAVNNSKIKINGEFVKSPDINLEEYLK